MRASSRGILAKGGPGLTVTTRHLGGQGGLRHSLRSSGKIRKKKLMGNKFEFADKLKEKRNYILYVSGMGHETKEIEEIEEMPQPPPKQDIIEQRQIIDNYQYHEIKNVKKVNPKIISITHHERLSIPLERTTLKKYSSYTSLPFKPYTKRKSIKTTRFGKETNADKFNNSSLYATKIEKNNNISPSTLYETYKPIKNTSFSKIERIISTGGNFAPNSNNIYERKNVTKIEKYKNFQRPPTEPNYEKKKQTRREVKQNGNNLIQRSIIQKQMTERRLYQGLKTEGRASPYEGFRPKDNLRRISIPKGGRPTNGKNELRNEERPRHRSRPDKPNYGPKPVLREQNRIYKVPNLGDKSLRRDEKQGIRMGDNIGSKKIERLMNKSGSRAGDKIGYRLDERPFGNQIKPKEPYGGNSFTQHSKYKNVNKTTIIQIGDREKEGKGLINRKGLIFGPGKEPGIGSYFQYKKYEQKSKLSKESNNSSLYQLNKSSEVRYINNYNNNISNSKHNNNIIDFPIHGKQTIKKNKLKKIYFNKNKE